MTFQSIKAFVPSGAQYERSKELFLEIGFELAWSQDDLCELRCGDCAFLLQRFENREMQDNFMLIVQVDDLDAFFARLQEKRIAERFPGVRFDEPKDRPWGQRELHFIDLAGVCWHFV